ncbi:PH domain-containing protein [Adhaeretor mobilis]|uniref:Bacterial membrane flanked domain protein n=1 Tax=Adhaeretor mobilis TaxID=1930276 RepID=A0A517MS57_9BACT|nr:PH domain-containing protein [Adhaeretor mobilis]QDS97720.1 Bacterial membrane flanked domain protein [Adhaeretor mobilis]
MKCKQCGAGARKDAVFCPKCGVPFAKQRASQSTKRRLTESLPAADEEAESVLWQGRFSPRAMFTPLATAVLFTVGLVLLAKLAQIPQEGWLVVAGLLGVVWIWMVGLLFYRTMSVHYSLTSQRLLHVEGLLWRKIDRIEAIDIDDVILKQGPIERLMGVGTVQLTSSDETTPEFHLPGIRHALDVATLIDNVRRRERRERGLYVESV